MDSRLDILIARCQATRAQTTELLENSKVLAQRLRETLQQVRQDRTRRSGMPVRELNSLREA
jgi:predicted metal-binding protein